MIATHPGWVSRLQAVSRGALAVVAGVPIIVLTGWCLNLEPFKRIQPGLVAMNPMTAVSFLLAAVALWAERRSPVVARSLGGAVALIGLLALGAILLHQRGVDQWLFPDRLGIGSATPNRMSPTTAAGFILMGGALLLAQAHGWRVYAAQLVTVVAAGIALLAVIGYLYGTTSLYQVKAYIPMALHTAVTFLALATAYLGAHPHQGLMARVTSGGAGGSMLRRMLVVVVVVPVALGWLVAGLADARNPTLAFSLLVVLIIAVFTLVTWTNAISLDRKDAERQAVAERLQRAHVELEARVADRTADLAGVLDEIGKGIGILGLSAADIVQSSTQFAASAANTATAVTQTTTTVEEIRQVAQVSSETARSVADSARTAVRIAEEGQGATEATGTGMQRIKSQMDSIMASMQRLQERSQAIADIIAAVSDIAKQSHVLSVNAAIEAARAGEQGEGFAVVAREIKHLAQQSKQATVQVRTLLAEVQQATAAAVLAAGQGSEAVAAGLDHSAQAGASILALAGSIDQAAQASMHIVTHSREQLMGMDQVATAMGHVQQASRQSADGAGQLEASSRELSQLGERLKLLAARYQGTGGP